MCRIYKKRLREVYATLCHLEAVHDAHTRWALNIELVFNVLSIFNFHLRLLLFSSLLSLPSLLSIGKGKKKYRVCCTELYHLGTSVVAGVRIVHDVLFALCLDASCIEGGYGGPVA